MRRISALLTVGAAATVVLSGPPATAGPAQIVLQVSDATVYEGDSGAALASFEVRRIGSHTKKAVAVGWRTADGSATAPGDYQASNGTLVFDNQHTVHVVTVPVDGDTAQEPDEHFLVLVDTAGGGDGEGRGTILNDDGWPDDTGNG